MESSHREFQELGKEIVTFWSYLLVSVGGNDVVMVIMIVLVMMI